MSAWARDRGEVVPSAISPAGAAGDAAMARYADWVRETWPDPPELPESTEVSK